MLSPLCNNKCYINTLFALLHSDHNCDVLQRWYCGGDGGGPATGLHAVCSECAVLGSGQLLLSGSGFRRIRMRYIYIYRTQTFHQIYSRTFYNTFTHYY